MYAELHNVNHEAIFFMIFSGNPYRLNDSFIIKTYVLQLKKPNIKETVLTCEVYI